MKRFPVKVTIDRPVGYQDSYGTIYPLNYGFVPGVLAGDGEEQDVYVLAKAPLPLKRFTGEVIAIVHRHDDVEDKWVATESDRNFTKAEIAQQVAFLEDYFDSEIEMLD